MKKKANTKVPALLRCGLAVILACGLMLPTTGLNAYGDQSQEVTPVLEVSDLAADEAAPADDAVETTETIVDDSTDGVTDPVVDEAVTEPENPVSESTPPPMPILTKQPKRQ